MQIKNPTSATLRPEAPAKSTPVSPTSATPLRGETAASRSERPLTDQVQISDAGRTLASANLDADVWQSSDLDPVRLEQLRSNVAKGTYLSSDMAELVARAIVRRGDL